MEMRRPRETSDPDALYAEPGAFGESAGERPGDWISNLDPALLF